jgi:sterol desaturase/sphingolipid hydroxylase (fatty acid hydroxylase superfamily)
MRSDLADLSGLADLSDLPDLSDLADLADLAQLTQLLVVQIAFLLPFSGTSLFYWLCDLHYRAELLAVYRSIAPLVALNLLGVQTAALGAALQVTRFRRKDFLWSECLVSLAIATLMFEVAFYLVHRLLHTARGYHHIHHIHHRLTETVALGAVYCHPLEHAFGNLLPTCAAFFVLEPHLLTVLVWAALAGVVTAVLHGGYAFGHRFHHLHHNHPFALLGLMDTVFLRC